MALVALKCPNCGGSLDLEDSREFAFCQYCGTKIMIQEEKKKQLVEVDDSKKISGWLDSAKLFLERGIPTECYRYASMATDADPNNSLAWYYRALSAPSRNDKLVAAVRAMDLISEDDPHFLELKQVAESVSNIVTVTIINNIGAILPLTTFFDDTPVTYDASHTAKIETLRGSHTVRVKVPNYVGKSLRVTVSRDTIFNIQMSGFGLSIKSFDSPDASGSSLHSLSDGKIVIKADSALKASITVTVKDTGESINIEPGETGTLSVSGPSGRIIVCYKSHNCISDVDFSGNPVYLAKNPGFLDGGLCRLIRQ